MASAAKDDERSRAGALGYEVLFRLQRFFNICGFYNLIIRSKDSDLPLEITTCPPQNKKEQDNPRCCGTKNMSESS